MGSSNTITVIVAIKRTVIVALNSEEKRGISKLGNLIQVQTLIDLERVQLSFN